MMHRRSFNAALRTAAVSLAGISALLTPAAPAAPAAAAWSPDVTSFVPVVPCRLVDTLSTVSRPQLVSPHRIRVVVGGQCGVPTSAVAVTVTVAVSNTKRVGWISTLPAGTASPTETLTFATGETRSQSFVVRTKASAIDITFPVALTEQRIIVDVFGAWMSAPGPVSEGRLLLSQPRMVLDTHASGRRASSAATITLGRLRLGVPTSAIAVSGILTVSSSSSAGRVTLSPAGRATPNTGSVYTDQANQTRSAGVIVSLGANGLLISLGAPLSAHVSFAVTGYVTGQAAPASTQGLVYQLPLQHRMTLCSWCYEGWVYPGRSVFSYTGLIGTVTVSKWSGAGVLSMWSGAAGKKVTITSWPARQGQITTMMMHPGKDNETFVFDPTGNATLVVTLVGYVLAADVTEVAPILWM